MDLNVLTYEKDKREDRVKSLIQKVEEYQFREK